jgi:hypothetical protein
VGVGFLSRVEWHAVRDRDLRSDDTAAGDLKALGIEHAKLAAPPEKA